MKYVKLVSGTAKPSASFTSMGSIPERGTLLEKSSGHGSLGLSNTLAIIALVLDS
jgi:hypothetical protein